MGGIGKTALAFKLADKLIDRYPDGQILINMNGTSEEPLTAAEAMAQVIHAYETDARLPASESALSGLYRSKLHNKRVLILLDNAANDDQVRPLLPPSSCGLIVTSREKFTLPGLIEKNLNILPTPDACAFLLKIASRIGDQAEELAILCGHLPLALRAASSLLANEIDLSIAEYLKELRNERTRLERIGGEGVDLDVEASFNLSYRRLKLDEAHVFRQLSVFPADFDANSEEYLCKDKGHKILSKFVRWSLVDFNEHNSRYCLHDLTRIFSAKNLLKEEGEAAYAAALQRYFIRYLNVLSKASELYERGEDNISLGLEILDRELANIQAGQAWAEKNAKLNVNAAALCIKYADSASILSLRLHPYNLIRSLEVSLEAARSLSKPVGECAALTNMGISYFHLGKTGKAIELYEQTLAIAREIGNRNWESSSLGNLGNTYSILGNMHKSIEYYNQSLAIFGKTGYKKGKGVTLGNLGNAYFHLGNMRKAIEYYNQALAISIKSGYRSDEGRTLGNLGMAYVNLGKIRQAIKCLEQALIIAQELKDIRSEGIALGNLGDAYSNLGESRKAIRYLDQSLRISLEFGNRNNEGANLCNLGQIYTDLGDLHKAVKCQEKALKISRETRNRQNESSSLGNLGLTYKDMNETHKAIGLFEQALTIASEIKAKLNVSEFLCYLGKAYLNLNDASKAIDYCTKSLDLARTIEYRKFEGEALCTLGWIFNDQDEPQKALEHCDPALTIFKDIEYPKGEAEALFARSQALHLLGQREEVVSCAQQAVAIFQRIESPLAEKVRQQLAEWGRPQET
jgi:tetratricopeptide (TPR) repeat protein